MKSKCEMQTTITASWRLEKFEGEWTEGAKPVEVIESSEVVTVTPKLAAFIGVEIATMKVKMRVSGLYDGDTYEAGDVVVCDPDYARRTLLYGHADVLGPDDELLEFDAAVQRLRIPPGEVAATAELRGEG